MKKILLLGMHLFFLVRPAGSDEMPDTTRAGNYTAAVGDDGRHAVYSLFNYQSNHT